MEHISKAIYQIETSNESQSSTVSLEKTKQGLRVSNESNELVLSKETFTLKSFTQVAATLKTAFPSITSDWLDLLCGILREEGYSDEKLKSAVTRVIKEEMYNHQAPAIAKFLNQINRVKLYSAFDIDVLVHQGKDSYRNFGIVHKGKSGAMFAKRADIEKYGIEEIQPTKIYEVTAIVSNDHE